MSLTGLPFLAAISISGPSSRIQKEDVPRIAPELQAAAQQIIRNFQSNDNPWPQRWIDIKEAS